MTDIDTRWNQLLETLSGLENTTELSVKDHLEVVHQLGGLRLIQPFDWNAWGAEMVPVSDLGRLDIHDCVRHITRLVRADRFSEGVLAGAIAGGYLRTLCVVARERAAGKPVPTLAKLA